MGREVFGGDESELAAAAAWTKSVRELQAQVVKLTTGARTTEHLATDKAESGTALAAAAEKKAQAKAKAKAKATEAAAARGANGTPP